MNKTETRKIIEQELEKATGPSNSDILPDEEALLVVPAEEEKTFSEPPVGLEAELAEDFVLLPLKWRKFLCEKNAETEDKISALSAQVERLKWVDDFVKAHAERINKYGLSSPQMWLEYLAKVEDLLEENPSQGVRFLAEAYGVAFAPASQPVASLQSKVAALEAHYQQLKSQVDAKERQMFRSLFDRFMGEKNEDGSPKHKYFYKVRPIMAALLSHNLAGNYEDAYAQALWLSPEVRQELIEAQLSDALKKKAADAQKAQQAAFEAKGRALRPAEDQLTTRQILERVINEN